MYVGESFGGIVGLNFAHNYPHRNRTLALRNTPCRLPLRERSGKGGDWDAVPSQSVGAWSAAIDNRLDTWMAPECHIAGMDQTSSSIARSLQGYLDALDFCLYLKEVETLTLLFAGEESPTSTLEQQRFMTEQLPDSPLVVYPGLDYRINAIHPERCTQQVREFVAWRTL